MPYSSSKSSYKVPECHTGNIEVLTLASEHSGTLYGGGWTRGARIMRDMAVIDLTGTLGMGTLDIEPINSLAQGAFSNLLRSLGMNAPLLNFYIKDYDIPDKKIKRPQWIAFARDIQNYLASGRDVLVTCTGGHGRTGMVLSILCYLINPKLVGNNPVPWIRKTLCHDCVETQEQIDYVYHILELPMPTNVIPNYWGGASGAYMAYDHTKGKTDKETQEGAWERWWVDFENGRLKCQ